MFTTKYMNFSRYYRQAFDPNIINISLYFILLSQICYYFSIYILSGKEKLFHQFQTLSRTYLKEI